ncbi:MAG: hypothetical protein WC712_07230, partial [Candidatus Brocadiia bacterium]
MERASEEEKLLYIQLRISEILCYVWDPIGVNSIPNCRFEYEWYVFRVFNLMMDGGDEKAIVALLDEISTVEMGGGPDPRAAEAARQIIA